MSALAFVCTAADVSPEYVAEIASCISDRLGFSRDRIECARRAVVTLLDRCEASTEVLIAPFETPWGAVLDLVRIDRGRHRVLESAPSTPKGNDWNGEVVVPPSAVAPGTPELTLRAHRIGSSTRDGCQAAWPAFDVASFVLAFPGQKKSGDAVILQETNEGIRACVIDALGHGDAASESAERLSRHLYESRNLPIEQAVASAHARRAAEPRGAALVVLDVDQQGRGTYVGIGNIDAIPLGESIRPSSCAGTIGLALHRIGPERVDIPAGSGLAIATDGIIIRWPTYGSSALAKLAAPLLLGAVLATAERRTDDSALMIVRRPL
jgi:hypothetical protein